MSDLSPRDSFILNSSRSITDLEKQSLTVLYRPMLTSDAYSLMMALIELNHQETVINEQWSHTILLNWLGIDLPSIVKARGQLEALGLLKSFRKQVDNRSLFLYQIQIPKDANEFFKDEVLSSLLLGAVGEEEFGRLSNLLINKMTDTADYYDVSKPFGDYYYFGQHQPNIDTAVQKAKAAAQSEVASAPNVEFNSNFDFKLLEQLLNTSFVDHESLINNQHLIMTEQTLYGINESDMAQYVKEATSYVDNKIDAKKLRSIIVQASKTNTKPVTPTVDTASASTKEMQGLSKVEQSVIKATFDVSPIDFIHSVKRASGGFTTAAEERVLTNIVDTGLLPVSVVNFLTYYLLVDQENATLNKNLAETIANDWLKNNIRTPQAALKYVKNRQKEPKMGSKRSYNRNNRRVVQKETLPDWAKESNGNEAKTSSNATTQKEIDEQLKKLRSRGKEG